jgi:hypothetical protein
MRIEATRHTPLIEWLVEDKHVIINVSGVSIPENAYTFFKPFEDFINSIDIEKQTIATVTLRLEYMNSLSSKAFLDYLRQLRLDKKLDMTVNWEFFSDDDDMREYGDTFSQIVGIPFNLLEIPADDRD